MLILMHTQTSIEAGFPYGQDCNQNAISGGRLSPLGAVGRRLAKKINLVPLVPETLPVSRLILRKDFFTVGLSYTLLCIHKAFILAILKGLKNYTRVDLKYKLLQHWFLSDSFKVFLLLDYSNNTQGWRKTIHQNLCVIIDFSKKNLKLPNNTLFSLLLIWL